MPTLLPPPKRALQNTTTPRMWGPSYWTEGFGPGQGHAEAYRPRSPREHVPVQLPARVRLDFIPHEELQMRPMAARGEVHIKVSFGPTSSPVLAHALSYAIEHAWATEQLRSGIWEVTFRINDAEGDYGALRHLLSMVGGWKTTRVEVDASVEPRQTVISMLGCAREWLRSRGRCGAWFPSERGAPRCRVCPLYDAGFAQEFWVPPSPVIWSGGEAEEVPDYVPEEWTRG